ncbi:amino acid permease [Maribacter polysiphoniae]|uniref:amino acid permease n=1 Tax=Maribacter polysiphoniae TaxID=429344 RepID=UPI002356BD63|nr:amino acid permease [Maribacter polysiphoniae]
MPEKKKFGTFAGVFTPSILTILGVIMYMRLGWVVGNAGLMGTLGIILIAHLIAVSTGLSVSSIATDKKIGAGGIYYVLSRSMGIPIGGSIGIALYVGTAFSIALYLIGFSESFNSYFGFGTTVDDFRITGTIALLALTVLAMISTSLALKAQFFILAAIAISLISIFFGTTEFAPHTVAMFSNDHSVSLEVVFAVFFPAVTGFTAGIAMSGDLKDPKKSIPIGTLAAIATGLIVYIVLAVFISFTVRPDILRSDYNILMKIALFAPAVVAGIWGATLSSALGGILGGPRILQAMSIDKVTPRVFGKGRGSNNEPINALFLVFVIAEAGILIGELDVIARVVSMFYLTAYGFINISYFLESWANPDFQPSFKIKRWIGLLGFIACFSVMLKLDMIAMIAALVVITVLYYALQRKEVKIQSNDVWGSVWENVVNKGLKKIDAKEYQNTNWNPNIILFSGKSDHQKYLLELGKTVSGRTGIVTNFKLILDTKNNIPLRKTEQTIRDENFQELGIFGRQIKVDNIYSGITNIASTFGFSGVEPNTIMMGWPKGLENSIEYSKMTETLLHLDYNLLYLDFDRKAKFGNYGSVDFWWRETDSKNAEMMLNIARFIIASPRWDNPDIRVLFVNNNNVAVDLIHDKIAKLVEDLRVKVQIKIINNAVEQKPFYDIIAEESSSTDLTLVGIPDYKIEKQAEFVMKTNHLFKTIGSTLLVKASHNFNELDLDLTKNKTTENNGYESNKTVVYPIGVGPGNFSDNSHCDGRVHF